MATRRPSNPLRDRLEGLSAEERYKVLNRLRMENEDSEFADLIRWGLEEVEQATVGWMCSLGPQLGGDSAQSSLLCSGRFQALELFKALVFGRSEPEEINNGE